MKTLTVALADIEGVPHGSQFSFTSVEVSARYTSDVTLTDGKIVPRAIVAKPLPSGGSVSFEVYASDDPAVRAEYRGFAVEIEAKITPTRGARKPATWRRTVKPLQSMASPISLGTLDPAEPLPPQWVSVADFAADLTATATDALAAAQSAQADAAQSAEEVTLAMQAQFLTQDEGVEALIDTAAGPKTQAALDVFHRDRRPVVVTEGAFAARPNQTSGTSAKIQAALEFARVNGRALYIPGYGPSAPWMLDANTTFALTAIHNGVTIIGDGPSTVLKMTDGHPFYSMFNISESAGPLSNIRISGLLIDGNKAGNPAVSTGFGIFAARSEASAAPDARGLTISDLWVKNCFTTGLNIFMSNALISNCHSWGHGMHGFGFREGHDIITTNTHAWDCGGYGYDISQNSHVTLIGGSARGCTMGGMKVTEYTRSKLFALTLNDNRNAGFTTTGPAEYIEMHAITAEGNDGSGIRVSEGSKVLRGSTVYAANNGLDGIYIDAHDVRLASVESRDNGGHGWHQINATDATLGSLTATGNSGRGANVAGARFVANGGKIAGNASDGAQIYGAAVGRLSGVGFGDSSVAGLVAARFANAAAGSVAGCDFTGVTGSRIRNYGTGAVRVRDNAGHITSNRGAATIAAGTTSVVVAHGLGVLPAGQDLTLNVGWPTGAVYASNITATTFTINAMAAPTSNLPVYWVIDADKPA